MKLRILKTQNPILRRKSLKVKKFDKKIEKLIADMWDTLKGQKDPEGVGLAAPQVGKNLRVFIVSHEGEERVIINPEIIKKDNIKSKSKNKKRKQILEGCLSLPHYYGPLERTESIILQYQTPKIVDGNWKMVDSTEKFSGFMAQIIEHEIDHLNGILFIDRILEQKKPLYHVKGNEWEEVELT